MVGRGQPPGSRLVGLGPRQPLPLPQHLQASECQSTDLGFGVSARLLHERARTFAVLRRARSMERMATKSSSWWRANGYGVNIAHLGMITLQSPGWSAPGRHAGQHSACAPTCGCSHIVASVEEL